MIFVILKIKLYYFPNILIIVYGKSNSSNLLCTTNNWQVLQDIKQNTNATITELNTPESLNNVGMTNNEEPTIVLLTLRIVENELFFGALTTLALRIDFLIDFFCANERFGFLFTY